MHLHTPHEAQTHTRKTTWLPQRVTLGAPEPVEQPHILEVGGLSATAGLVRREVPDGASEGYVIFSEYVGWRSDWTAEHEEMTRQIQGHEEHLRYEHDMTEDMTMQFDLIENDLMNVRDVVSAIREEARASSAQSRAWNLSVKPRFPKSSSSKLLMRYLTLRHKSIQMETLELLVAQSKMDGGTTGATGTNAAHGNNGTTGGTGTNGTDGSNGTTGGENKKGCSYKIPKLDADVNKSQIPKYFEVKDTEVNLKLNLRKTYL
ncbi:hypothetical protein L1987_06996 [Smallanthus sonchifolius]|uniref:Uncharacterized protein n=1 Tax=Smallanthus sonchifolius TaxID=185202 RepID=A0ACB9JZV1_9ASTR|nr:hypothetical protein L1987_06996 [Smallanthus sonchifolius]